MLLVVITVHFALFFQHVACYTFVNLQINESVILKNRIRDDNGLYYSMEYAAWRLHPARLDKGLRLTFLAMDVQMCTGCSCDRVILFQAGNDTKPFETFCGHSLPDNRSYIFDSDHTTIVFRTNIAKEFTGFKLFVEEVEVDSKPCNSTSVIRYDSVDLTRNVISNYQKATDGSYRENESCKWIVIAPENSRLVFYVQRLDLGRCDTTKDVCDQVTFYNGPFASKNVTLAVLNATTSGSGIVNITSINEQVLIAFQTDDIWSNSTGFMLYFETATLSDTDAAVLRKINTLIISSVIIVLAIIFLVIAISAVIIFRRKSQVVKLVAENNVNLNQNETISRFIGYLLGTENYRNWISSIQPNGAEILKRWFYECCVDPESIRIAAAIGEGHYAVVSEAFMGQIQVAVKSQKSMDAELAVELLKEGYLMKDFDHENVITLLGVAIVGEKSYLIFPFMENGNLFDHLKAEESLSIKDLVSYCRQICSGMRYISELGIVHRDVACRNILLDKSFGAKISDFGMAQSATLLEVPTECSETQGALPLRWYPPEALLGTSRFSTKSDVWSYGVTLWEMFSGCQQRPYHDLANNEIIEFLQAGNRLLQPATCPNEIFGLMKTCWRYKCDERPGFADILKELEEYLRNNNLKN